MQSISGGRCGGLGCGVRPADRDASLRRQMGEMGRRRAVEQFAWPRIIRSYERLWGSRNGNGWRERRGRTRPANDTTVQPCILPRRPHSSATPASGCEKRTGS